MDEDLIVTIPRQIAEDFVNGKPIIHHRAERALLLLLKRNLKTNDIEFAIEDNKGGDYLVLRKLDNDEVEVDCAQSCVRVIYNKMRASVLIGLLVRAWDQGFEKAIPYDGEIKQVLVDSVRKIK